VRTEAADHFEDALEMVDIGSGEHGRGFSSKNLRHMLRFAEVFEVEEIVYALSRQLSWTHLRSLTYIEKRCMMLYYYRNR
jgi:hypothetical protein